MLNHLIAFFFLALESQGVKTVAVRCQIKVLF